MNRFIDFMASVASGIVTVFCIIVFGYALIVMALGGVALTGRMAEAILLFLGVWK